jgi:ribonuclease R
MGKGFAFFVSDSEKKMPDIYIPQQSLGEAKDTDRVVVRITEWETGSGKRPVGEVVSVLNAEDPNDMAMKEILLGEWISAGVSGRCSGSGGPYSGYHLEKEIEKRKDFRNILTFTIDPVDAKTLTMRFPYGF